jgi:hypothetical protein
MARDIRKQVNASIPRAGTLGLIAGARALEKMNNPKRAEEILRRSRDPVARLELYLLQRKTGQKPEAELALRDLARTLDDEWPTPLVRGYLGEWKDDRVIAAAGDSDERCEAEYYLGRLHAADDVKAARRHLQNATHEDCDEADFAREELDALQSR